MAVIPYQTLDRQISRRRTRKFVIMLALAAAVIVALVLVHIFFTPLDVVWFKTLRRIGILLGVELVQ